MGIEIQWTDSLESLAKVLYDSAIDVGAVCACVMTSRGCSFVLFRLQPTWCLDRGVQKCGYISREKMTTGPLAERYGVTITLMNLNQATAARLTLALHLLILKVNSNSLLCHLYYCVNQLSLFVYVSFIFSSR